MNCRFVITVRDYFKLHPFKSGLSVTERGMGKERSMLFVTLGGN